MERSLSDMKGSVNVTRKNSENTDIHPGDDYCKLMCWITGTRNKKQFILLTTCTVLKMRGWKDTVVMSHECGAISEAAYIDWLNHVILQPSLWLIELYVW